MDDIEGGLGLKQRRKDRVRVAQNADLSDNREQEVLDRGSGKGFPPLLFIFICFYLIIVFGVGHSHRSERSKL
jgi:hypothetical protein